MSSEVKVSIAKITDRLNGNNNYNKNKSVKHQKQQ